LMNNGLIDKEYNFINEKISKMTDPLSKLLYAMAWKNGDLKKIKHIIKGVLNEEDPTEALVFQQFGRYLKLDSKEPIIDQHVIRAFAVYKLEAKSEQEIQELRKINSINKKHESFISSYKEWLKSEELKESLRNLHDYSYYIDKLLFAAGKTIKISNNKSINDK
jgi:hypothetical protein